MLENDKPIKYIDNFAKEYYIYNQYDRRKFPNKNIYENIVKKLDILETKKIVTKFGTFEVEKSRMGNTKTQPEMNIFSIKIPDVNEIGEIYTLEYKINLIEDIILFIKNKLDGKIIKINSANESLDLEIV